MPRRSLTLTEAAAELGLSKQRVSQLVRSMRLRTEQIGRAKLLSPTAIERIRTRPPDPGGRPKKILRSVPAETT